MRAIILLALLAALGWAKETLFVVQREFSALSTIEEGKVIGWVKNLRNLNHGVVKFEGKDGYLISRDGYVIKFDPIKRVKVKEYRTSQSAIGFIVEPDFLAVANYDDKTVEILDRDLNPLQKIETGSKNVGIKAYKDYLAFSLMDKDQLWVMKNVKRAGKAHFERVHVIEQAGIAPFDAMIRGDEYIVGFFRSPHFGVLNVETGHYRKIGLNNREGKPVLKVPHFGFWSIAKERIFIPAVGDSQVHVFNPEFKPIGSVEVAGNPVFTSLSPDEKLMAVTFSGEAFPVVQILDTQKMAVIKTLRFDGSILHVRWSEEEPLLFLSDNTSNQMIALNTRTWERAYEVTVRTPSGIFIHKEP